MFFHRWKSITRAILKRVNELNRATNNFASVYLYVLMKRSVYRIEKWWLESFANISTSNWNSEYLWDSFTWWKIIEVFVAILDRILVFATFVERKKEKLNVFVVQFDGWWKSLKKNVKHPSRKGIREKTFDFKKTHWHFAWIFSFSHHRIFEDISCLKQFFSWEDSLFYEQQLSLSSARPYWILIWIEIPKYRWHFIWWIAIFRSNLKEENDDKKRLTPTIRCLSTISSIEV